MSYPLTREPAIFNLTIADGATRTTELICCRGYAWGSITLPTGFDGERLKYRGASTNPANTGYTFPVSDTDGATFSVAVERGAGAFIPIDPNALSGAYLGIAARSAQVGETKIAVLLKG